MADIAPYRIQRHRAKGWCAPYQPCHSDVLIEKWHHGNIDKLEADHG